MAGRLNHLLVVFWCGLALIVNVELWANHFIEYKCPLCNQMVSRQTYLSRNYGHHTLEKIPQCYEVMFKAGMYDSVYGKIKNMAKVGSIKKTGNYSLMVRPWAGVELPMSDLQMDGVNVYRCIENE